MFRGWLLAGLVAASGGSWACSAAPGSQPAAPAGDDAGAAAPSGGDAAAAPPDDASPLDAPAPLDAPGPDAGACRPVQTSVPAPAPSSTGIFVESFAGPITDNEVASFKSFIETLVPAPDNTGNAWAQHQSGQQTEAMGILYEMTGDVAILDRMIAFCDAVLSERNDLAPAPVGQHVLWTGGIDPAWPNNLTAPIGTAGEQGDPIGHLGSCARLILQTPALASAAVAGGDPHGYGATYLERAKRYVKEGDFAVDGHVLKSLLDLTSNKGKQMFAAGAPGVGGNAVPWNQQMMLDYGFESLAAAHAILGDDPARVQRYEAIAQGTMDWFFSGGGAELRTDAKGNPSYFWGYTVPNANVEDNSHSNLDVDGFFRAYVSGRYGVTAARMTPFANTLLDIMERSPQSFAGRVDGTDGAGNSAPTTYIRSGWLLASEFRPSAYAGMMASGRMAEGAFTGSIDAFARLAWLKTRRCLAGVK
jgi:hypothetical protein